MFEGSFGPLTQEAGARRASATCPRRRTATRKSVSSFTRALHTSSTGRGSRSFASADRESESSKQLSLKPRESLTPLMKTTEPDSSFETMAVKAQKLSRRQAVTRAGVLVGAALATGCQTSAQAESKPAASHPSDGFVFCLNTATIRGQKLGILKEIEVAAKAGYQAIEPWIDSIEEYKRQDGTLPELKRRIADTGLA